MLGRDFKLIGRWLTIFIVAAAGALPAQAAYDAPPPEDGRLEAYQLRMMDRGEADRAGTEGLDVISLLPEIVEDELETVLDPRTGKLLLPLTIEEVLVRTLRNSPEITVVSFDPEISREDIIRAQSEFDFTTFGGANYESSDFPNNSAGSFFTGPEPLVSESKTRTLEAGLRQRTTLGSEWSLAWTGNRNWDNFTGRRLNTWYQPMLTFQLRQPLLRDAWREVNLADVNIAGLNYEATFISFRRRVEEVAVAAISAYWQLIQAREDVDIQEELLESTMETLRMVEARREIDATAVQIKQTEAELKSREAVLIVAEKRVMDVQDVLLRLLADPQANLLSGVTVIPVTAPDTVPLQPDVIEALKIAMEHNPLVQQALLRIDLSDINLGVARRQKMPRLDLVATAGVQGFASDALDAQEGLTDDEFTNTGIGLTIEYPLGNRQREAELRQRRLERSQAGVNLQNVSDQVALDVKERIRQVQSSYEEMIAQGEAADAAKINLQALEDTEPIRGRLTPEYMLLKLDAQQSVAEAQRRKVAAVTEFNIAMAELARAQGTVLQMHRVHTSMPAQ